MLEEFTSKMLMSGYSKLQMRDAMIAGLSGYANKVAREKMLGTPIHREGASGKALRRLDKLCAKSTWFKRPRTEQDLPNNQEAPTNSPPKRRRVNITQNNSPTKVPDTVMFVPKTRGGALATILKAKERELSTYMKTSIRIMEEAGTKLVHLITKADPFLRACGRVKCTICTEGNEKMVGRCYTRNVTYKSTCSLCKDLGVASTYIGETSRSVLERELEHRQDAQGSSENSHRRSHIESAHPERSHEDPNKHFVIEIMKTHKSSFQRLVHEALEIRRGGESLLNKKEEYCRNLLPNLQLEFPMSKKQEKVPETLPWYVDKEVDKLDRKDRVPEPLRNPPKRVKTSSGVVRVRGSETTAGPSTCSSAGPSTVPKNKPLRQMQITAYTKSPPAPEMIATASDAQDANSHEVRIVNQGQEVPEEGQDQGHEQVEVRMKDAGVKEDDVASDDEDQCEPQDQEQVSQSPADEPPVHEDEQESDAQGYAQGDVPQGCEDDEDSQEVGDAQCCEEVRPGCDVEQAGQGQDTQGDELPGHEDDDVGHEVGDDQDTSLRHMRAVFVVYTSHDQASQGYEDEPPGHETEQQGSEVEVPPGEGHEDEHEAQARSMRTTVALWPDNDNVIQGQDEDPPRCMDEHVGQQDEVVREVACQVVRPGQECVPDGVVIKENLSSPKPQPQAP